MGFLAGKRAFIVGVATDRSGGRRFRRAPPPPTRRGRLLNWAFRIPPFGVPRRVTHGISCRQARLHRGRGD